MTILTQWYTLAGLILLWISPGFSQPGNLAELENEYLKISFSKSTRTTSILERSGDEWLPVVSGASATVIFRGRDSLSMHRTSAVPVTKILPYEDRVGTGRRLDIRIADQMIEWHLSYVLYDHQMKGSCIMQIRNASDSLWKLKEIRPIDLYGAGGLHFASSRVLMHVNGYQSWSTSEVVQLGPVTRPTSHWSTVFHEPEAFRSVLIGFLTNAKAKNVITVNGFDSANATVHCSVVSDVHTVNLSPGDTLSLDHLCFSMKQSPVENLKEYGNLLSLHAPVVKKPFIPAVTLPRDVAVGPSIPTGWCSWYYYYQNISEDSILQNLNAAARYFRKTGLKYIQIDDGFQRFAGDWETNEKFPHGHRWLVDQIHKKGFLAGLWVAPFAVAESSSVFRDHPDWLLRDERDSLKEFFANDWWGGRIYSLDPSLPQVRVWLEELFYTITARWGYDYVKIDFLYFAAEGGTYRQNVSSAQAYQMGLEAIRRGVGSERLILGCGAPIGSSIGYVDGMRIGQDVYAGWGGITPGVNAAAERFFYHNTTWYNDPDCLLVREPLTLEQARSWASVVALSGQMNILSDKLTALSPERIELITRTLPSYGVSAEPVDLFGVSSTTGLTLHSSDDALEIRLPSAWKFSIGDSLEWKEPTFQDDAWKEITVPSRWENSGFPDVDGFTWYRTKFRVPAEWRRGDIRFSFGKIDDCDQTFVNGNLVGKTGTFPPSYATEWTSFREYIIPENLIRWDGENVIAVRVYDGGGPGGIWSTTDLQLPKVWNLPIEKKFGTWNVVGIFNWSNRESSLRLTPEVLGLSPRKSYVAYELWTNRFLGELSQDLVLPPTASRILAVHEKKEQPFVVSTGRHITQGAIDLVSSEWNSKKRVLLATSREILDGKYSATVWIPPGMKFLSVSAAAKTTISHLSDDVVQILFEGVKGDKLAWNVRFQ